MANGPDARGGAVSAARGTVIFVGGFGDAGSGIVRFYSDRFSERNRDLITVYRSWDDGDAISTLMTGLPTQARIGLVGHSWGGDTAAMAVAAFGARGRQMDVLVTIDPVGRGTSQNFFSRVRAGTRLWFNVNAMGGSSLQGSNIMAGIGSAYNEAPMAYAHVFINAPMTHEDFWGMMQGARDARGRTAEDVVRGP